jgi:hypothetical protein
MQNAMTSIKIAKYPLNQPDQTDLRISELSLSNVDVKPSVEFTIEAMEASISRSKINSEHPRSILRQPAYLLNADSKKELMAMGNVMESLKRSDSGRFSDPGCPLSPTTMHAVNETEMRRYVLASVTDDVFSYVEEKGMEMEIRVKEARYQGSFMLAALREMREDSRVAKQKRQEVESSDKGNILGPLLGPNIKADKGPAPPRPDGFELPENLEFVGLEIDLPVGFRRLRWAFCHKDSLFVKDAVFRAESKYDNITFGDWNKHNDIIGAAALPPDVTEKEIVGAEKETSYLMPKSAFVGANMAAETNIITAYNDYCFFIKKRCLTPDVPYGSTFVAWTQLVFTNTGNNTTHLVCSVEAEFPNGPPMVGRQIKSGMRSGVGDLFVLMGETIVKYSDEFPA